VSVHHQMQGEDAKSFKANGDGFLTIEEQPYERTWTVGQSDAPIPLGWLGVEQVGILILWNITGKSRQVVPTEEERAEDATAVVVLSAFPGIVIPPSNMPTILHVGPDFQGTSIRSLGADARITLLGIAK
jgi:hypothetical protein